MLLRVISLACCSSVELCNTLIGNVQFIQSMYTVIALANSFVVVCLCSFTITRGFFLHLFIKTLKQYGWNQDLMHQ